jgi:glycosyltransferase involved in cell wall biosynthesis
MRITATVITLNEEHNIAAALESLSWADEIIVVDSESSDKTVEIAHQFTDKVIVRPWPGYSTQKNFAAEKAAHDWIFSLDADERVSDELALAIAEIKRTEDSNLAAFEFNRRSFYLGRWIKHSGWNPDYKIRLYDRRRARWTGDFVHEALAVEGPVKRLSGDLLHYTVRDASEHHLRMDRYTTLAAEKSFQEGKRSSFISVLFSPSIVFVRSYLLKLGFLDGIPGLAIAWFASHYQFLKALKLWEKQNSSASKKR